MHECGGYSTLLGDAADRGSIKADRAENLQRGIEDDFFDIVRVYRGYPGYLLASHVSP